MLTQEQLIAYWEGTLRPAERARVEELLREDAVARQQLLDQQRIHEALRVMLANDAANERVKQSILAVVRGQSEPQLKARVLEQTRAAFVESVKASERSGVGAWVRGCVRAVVRLSGEAWQQVRRLAGATIQRSNATPLQRLLRSGSAAAVLVLALGAYFYFHRAPVPRIAIGQFAVVMGKPKVQHAGKPPTLNAQPSTPVHFGDRIETGDADKAEIQFGDGTTLSLNFNTALEIPNPKSEIRNPKSPLSRPSQVNLLRGQIWSRVQKTTNAPQFAVRTPVATATVTGTEFGLKLQKTKPAKPSSLNSQASTLFAILTVKEGAVEFSNAFGKVDGTALTESQASADTAPTEPARIAALKTFRLTTINFAVTNPKLFLQDETERMVFPAGWIGINLASAAQGEPVASGQPLPGTNALRISRVWRDSPAEQAGLQVGDLVSAVNGQVVTNQWQMAATVVYSLNRPITLSLQRAGEQKVVTLTPVTPFNAPALPGVPANVQKPLFDATWQLISAGFQHRIAPGQTTEGEIALQQLVHSYPDCAAIHHILAFLHEAKDELGEAIRYHQRAVELDPQAALYHFNLGRALRGIGNFDRAVQELEEAARLAPGWWLTAYWLADAYTLVERHADAVNAVDAGLRLNPFSPDLFEQKAEVLLRGRQSDAALPAALKAVELDPAKADAHLVLGNVYFDLGRIDDAEAAYRQAIAQGGNIAYLNLAGLLHKQRGQLDEAEALYRKALEREPDDARALDGLGTVLRSRGQFTEAERMHRKALEIAPGSSLINNNLGEVLREQGRLDEAERMYRKALELDPNYVAAYGNLGTLHAMRRQFAEAEKILRALLELSSELLPADKLPTLANLASVCSELGKLEEAEKLFREALAMSPNHPDVCNGLAWLLAEHGLNLDEALVLSRRALQTAPNDASYLDTLGWVHFQRGELAEAEATLKKALELAGENPPASEVREHLKKVQEKKVPQPK